MLFRAVKELRLEGKLEEALQMANDAIADEPDNIWNMRALAWVYFEHLKSYSSVKYFNEFKEYLIKIKDLELPKSETMIFDSCAWKIGKMVFELQKKSPVDFSKIDTLFEIIKGFYFSQKFDNKPSLFNTFGHIIESDSFVFIYTAFHKGYRNWDKYLEFAEWWNFKNFRDDDHLKQDFKGEKLMSVAEQAYIAYSNSILERKLKAKTEEEKSVVRNKIQIFFQELDTVIKEHPEHQYLPYYKAKLLLALGNEKDVMSAFLPFAKLKRNDFWVWELMADIHKENPELHFACYCKALSLKTREDFLVKIRQSFADILIRNRMYNAAKTEIQIVISTRENHKWKLPNEIVHWTEQEWYKSASVYKTNADLYATHFKKAEFILFQDEPEEIIAIEFVNENKSMISFVKDKTKYGFFNYSKHLKSPKIGDLLKVRFNKVSQDRYYTLLSAEYAGNYITIDAIMDFEENLQIIAPHNFGFANDVFIDSKTISENNLIDGQIIRGTSILSFNKKKNEWGRKAITIFSP